MTTHKVRVSGFFTWFMDSYDWLQGFSTKRGLYHIDFENKDRIDKASARYYRTLIEHNGDDFTYPPRFVSDGQFTYIYLVHAWSSTFYCRRTLTRYSRINYMGQCITK